MTSPVVIACCLVCAGEIPDADQVADAIWRAEGGARARVPYGVLAVPVKDALEARQVAKRTVLLQWVRWANAGRPGCYFDSLADRYCPPATDRQGNLNWKRNIRIALALRPGGPRFVSPRFLQQKRDFGVGT